MRALHAFGCVAVALFASACATAVDDTIGITPGDAHVNHDGAVTNDASEQDSSLDSSAVDSGGGDDMAPEDSTIDPGDTDVPDTDPGFPDTDPGFDTAPGGGGLCTWCSSGSCSSDTIDESCLITCISAGYFDCTYDPTSSPPCLCHD